jgi:bifunctional UDP-N-acetylglucosamine pyrophosphorylase/glucosamine-1-phosphate N-acetyltransferase
MLVVYGDMVVSQDDITSVGRRFAETGHAVVLTEQLCGTQRSVDWICASSDKGQVQAIYGPPRNHYVNARLAGVFALPKNSVRYLAANPGHMENVCVGGMPPKESQVEQSIQMMVEDGLAVDSVEVQADIVDIDKPWHIAEANSWALKELQSQPGKEYIGEGASVDGSADVRGRLTLGRRSRIGRNVIIKGDVFIGDDVLVDSGAIIEGNVMIGDRSRITDYCMIKTFSINLSEF